MDFTVFLQELISILIPIFQPNQPQILRMGVFKVEVSQL